MKKLLSKWWPCLLAVVLFIAVWLFWRVGYPHALAYQEQFQLFLFDGDYFSQRMAVPGGFSRWLAELLVQFYNNTTIGAAFIALLYVGIYALGTKLTGFRILSLIPVLLLWYTMGDENVMLTYGVSLFLSMMVCWLVVGIARWPWLSLAVAVLVMPLTYWMVGPLALLPAACMGITAMKSPKKKILLGAATILSLLMVVLTIVWSSHHLPYPTDRFYIGIDYYRVPQVLPLMFAVIPVTVLLLAGIGIFVKPHIKPLVQGLTLAAILVLAFLLVPGGFDAKKYELIDYDYLVRSGQWKAIIEKAQQQQPDLPMSVSATNLALAMENQLGERAFQFYQRGTQGLVSPFERNFATTQLLGEIYFRLGLVNTAQHYAFEAMEALPNYAKSARVVRRLAETNLINGQYDVARKYLQMLQKTLFYRKWADQTLQLLGNEDAINEHPLYGYLRKVRLDEDFLFSDKEIDKMCGQLFMHNKNNTVAMQYLLMWPLLNRDIPTFMQYVQAVQTNVNYNPRHIQEAICYAFGQQQQQPPQQLVSNMVAQQFLRFADAFNRGGRQNPQQLEVFKNTVWYYLVKNP